jgi:hypothetical protein
MFGKSDDDSVHSANNAAKFSLRKILEEHSSGSYLEVMGILWIPDNIDALYLLEGQSREEGGLPPFYTRDELSLEMYGWLLTPPPVKGGKAHTRWRGRLAR